MVEEVKSEKGEAEGRGIEVLTSEEKVKSLIPMSGINRSLSKRKSLLRPSSLVEKKRMMKKRKGYHR